MINRKILLLLSFKARAQNPLPQKPKRFYWKISENIFETQIRLFWIEQTLKHFENQGI